MNNKQHSFVVSSISDNNIFHIFLNDILRRYKPEATHILVSEVNIDKQHPCQQWRWFVLNKLYSDAKLQYIDRNLQPSEITHPGYNHVHFAPSVSIDPHIFQVYQRLQSKSKGEYILLNQRSLNNRYLYDDTTELPLQEWLQTKQFGSYPLKWCNFETMTPEEQYEVCSKAVVFISAHGAGCTNCLFTPQDCPLIEINFRKHWYCDPVCQDHISGKVSVNEKCNGILQYNKHFHKADYHNLCCLIGKPYIEIEATRYGGGFTSINPISKEKVFLNGNDISEAILLSMQTKK